MILNKNLIFRLVRHVLLLSCIGFFVTYLVFLSINNITIIDVITSLELFSLAVLVIVNGEIAQGIDKRKMDLKAINYFILTITLLVMVFMVVNLLGLEFTESRVEKGLLNIITIIKNKMYWLSAFPLVAYAILDLHIATSKNSSEKEKIVASYYLIFADIVCVFPLIILFCGSYIYSILTGDYINNIELFVSGSMAIVLMSSAIATKAIDIFVED